MRIDVRVDGHIKLIATNATSYIPTRIPSFCAGSSCHVELGDVTLHKIGQLRKLNQAIYPFSYNHTFYDDVLEIGELAKLVYFNDIVVGAVCCSVDHSQNQKRLYIVTLGCLTSYRRHGVGTAMLNHVLNICDKDDTFDNIYTHVQISNKSAINFYQRFRFAIIGTERNFYQELERPDAHVLQRSLHCQCVHLTRELQIAE
ncbi:N-alpha-acetyltransferase 50-like [Genypterus blacodes]|uniref:N-alpha-acetyltransferase 50-like n=1 Tax=Genypterus blacodes TaxID=154954 RepID=UPI003F7766F1